MTAVARPRGRPRSEEVDHAILSATVDELIERGFAAMTIERIAVRAGVAKSTIYRRWVDAHELGVAAVRGLLVHDDTYPPGPAREVLFILLDTMRRTWADARYAALMRRVAADGTESPELYRSARDKIVGPTVRRMNRAVAQAIDEGLIRPDVDIEQVRTLLTAPILAAGLTHKGRVTKAQLDFYLETILTGLRPAAPE